jgi:hypothetical protein
MDLFFGLSKIPNHPLEHGAKLSRYHIECEWLTRTKQWVLNIPEHCQIEIKPGFIPTFS